jgi:hypothetical protein
MYLNRILSIGLALSALLAGCATPVSTNIQPSAASVAKYGEMTDINVVATLEKNINDAKAAGMAFLAPNYFKEAAQVLSETKNQLGNQPKAVLAKNAARGDAILDKGRAVMDIVKYRFAQELEIKARIDALNTATLLPKDYEKTMGDFSRLIQKVEREQQGNIDHDKEALLRALQHLEVHAVQEGALHEADLINAESRKNNAEKQAPVTYAEARRVFDDAKQRIAAAPRDDKLVHSLGAQALFAARHAQQVNARVARLLADLNVGAGGGVSVGAAAGSAGGAMAGVQVGGASAAEKPTAEKIVLQEEDRLQGIATALGLRDLRDQPLDKQVEEIKRTGAELARQGKGALMQDYEARLKAANDATRQATDRLAEQARKLAEQQAQISALTDKLAKAAAPAGKTAAPSKKGKPAKKPRAQPAAPAQ